MPRLIGVFAGHTGHNVGVVMLWLKWLMFKFKKKKKLVIINLSIDLNEILLFYLWGKLITIECHWRRACSSYYETLSKEIRPIIASIWRQGSRSVPLAVEIMFLGLCSGVNCWLFSCKQQRLRWPGTYCNNKISFYRGTANCVQLEQIYL